MENKKVAILLSTYNGEKYIKEQLDSILSQNYLNIEIYVRDDGSKDQTISILKEYEKREKIHLTLGENLGFINSFFTLLNNCDDADYYAFSDQDDIWLEDKVKRAVEILEENNNETIPIMYYSNYDFYCADMTFKSHSKKRSRTSFLNSLFECVNLGMVTLINKKARKQILETIPKQDSLGHDWWIYMICEAFGKVIYDDLSNAQHRIHSNNTSKCEETTTQKYKRRISTLFYENHFKKVNRQIQQFSECCYSKLTKDHQKIINLFLNPKTFTKQIRKVFYPRKIMNLWNEEIILRVGFLFGQI